MIRSEIVACKDALFGFAMIGPPARTGAAFALPVLGALSTGRVAVANQRT
jgi:hypothetical protein